MSVATFYVDGHNGITDAQNVWTADASAFDGNTATSASTSAAGSVTNNALTGLGTNANTTFYTGTITQVRTRIYGKPASSSAYLFGYVTGADSALSGGVSPFVTGVTAAAWGSYVTMNTPSGGWTWQRVRDIKGTVYSNTAAATTAHVIEVEVTFTAPKASTFIHQFPGTTLDTNVWSTYTFGTGTITVNDKVTLEYNGGSTNQAQITSKVGYDLSESSIYFKMDVSIAGMGCIVGLVSASGLYATIDGTSINVWAGGASRISYTFTDQAMYFKFREASGVLYLDTSVDNVTYTNRGSLTLATYSLDLTKTLIEPKFTIN